MKVLILYQIIGNRLRIAIPYIDNPLLDLIKVGGRKAKFIYEGIRYTYYSDSLNVRMGIHPHNGYIGEISGLGSKTPVMEIDVSSNQEALQIQLFLERAMQNLVRYARIKEAAKESIVRTEEAPKVAKYVKPILGVVSNRSNSLEMEDLYRLSYRYNC